MSMYMLTFIHTAGYAYLPGRVTYAYKTYRATPTIKLLERRSARGSAGSVMRPQSWIMSAPMTSRFGSFLNEDLAPRVAASLQMSLSTTGKVRKNGDVLPQETKTAVASREQLWGKEHARKGS
jgi:hypothetical protein